MQLVPLNKMVSTTKCRCLIGMISQRYSAVDNPKPTIRSSDKFYFSHLVFIRYEDNGSVKSGSVSIKLEFTPANLSINYVDVQYDNPRMEQIIESNPSILSNIDSYLRNQLLRMEFNC
jgi:hypothetical protein